MASPPRAHGSPRPTVAAAIVIGMLAMIVIPATLTLHADWSIHRAWSGDRGGTRLAGGYLRHSHFV